MLIPVQGCWWLEPAPDAQGIRLDPPWRGHLSITGPLTHIYTHSDLDNLDTQFTLGAHLWDMEGIWSPQRKSTQIWGEYAILTQTVAPGGNWCFLLIKIITKWCWIKWRCSRTCCVAPPLSPHPSHPTLQYHWQFWCLISSPLKSNTWKTSWECSASVSMLLPPY